MTDFSLTDAITGQSIKRWDRVVMCFLSHERSGIARLFTDHPTEQCKFASLPINAQWDGSNFIVDDHDIAVKMALRAVQVHGRVHSIEDLVEHLRHGQNVKNSSKSFGYSVFACKENTIKLLQKNDFLIGSSELADFDFMRANVRDEYASIIPTAKEIKDREEDIPRRNFAYQCLDEIEPLYGISNRAFTDQLVELLDYKEFYKQKIITDSGELSDDFWSLYQSLYMASFISNALEVMEMSLLPSRMIESESNASRMSHARVSLMANVLEEEMADLVIDTYDNYSEMEANKLLDPLRITVQSIMRKTE